MEFPTEWLREHEARGGITLQRYVGRTAAQLQDRLRRSRRARRATAFHDIKTACYHAREALRLNAVELNNWESHAEVGDSTSLEYAASEMVGWGVYRDEPGVVDLHRLRLIVEKTGPGECLLYKAEPIR